METEILLPEIKKESQEGNTVRFVIEPLFPGFGVTVGNSMRRVLLSSLPGAAPYKVKIQGVTHEFSSLPHVKEDIVEVLLNLKALRFKLHSEKEAKTTLEISKAGEVTGKDFKLSSDLELANPEQHIATLSKSGKLKIELWVNRGIGYVPIERREDERNEIGVIALDSLYSPVRKVNYAVENTRVGRMTNYDKVTLEITTDGTIDADEALEKSGKILTDHFSLIAEASKNAQKSAKKEAAKKQTDDLAQIKKTAISEMKFSNRTTNALLNSGIKTVGGLIKSSPEKLVDVKGLGQKGVDEIKKVLKKKNLSLKESK